MTDLYMQVIRRYPKILPFASNLARNSINQLAKLRLNLLEPTEQRKECGKKVLLACTW